MLYRVQRLLFVLPLLALPSALQAQTYDRIAVDSALARGLRYLEHLQRADGALCDPTNPLFETWETIIAAQALRACGRDTTHPVLQQALSYLQTQENPDGLLCHNRRCREGYCIETSVCYLLLLNSIDRPQAVAQRLGRLAGYQRPAGDWLIGNPDVRERQDFASVTAFMLMLHDQEAVNRKAAVSALLQQQTAAGDWGQSWEYYGCTAYALWPALCGLRPADGSEAQAARMRAIAWISAGQRPDGSWADRPTTDTLGVSISLQTALITLALAAAPAEAQEVRIADALSYLLACQKPDGHWDGGRFPIPSTHYRKYESVCATAWALQALCAWRTLLP